MIARRGRQRGPARRRRAPSYAPGMGFLTARTRRPERMDAPEATDAEIGASLRFLGRLNRFLGGVGPVVDRLEAWTRDLPADRPIAVLDLGTGDAALPRAIARWARATGRRVRIVALEPHPTTLAHARRASGDWPEIRLVRADARRPPFAARSFDFAVASLLLHHLSDLELLKVLAAMGRIAPRGVVWSDLLRGPVPRLATWLGTRLAPPVVRHDARVSVEAGFSPEEVAAIRDRLGWRRFRFRRHWGYRFTLAGVP